MFDIFRVKQQLKYCVPDRQPPDPILFPQYFQNDQHMWCRFSEWWPRDRPPSKCIGVVYIVNGLGEYSGRYDGFANFLTSKGFVVFSQDNQGAGGSEGLRLYVDNFTDFVRDVFGFMMYIEGSRYPSETSEILCPTGISSPSGIWDALGMPFSDRRFLVGHSMGGLISTLVAQQAPPAFFGCVVLSGAALIIANMPGKAKQNTLRFFGKCFPKMKVRHGDGNEDLCTRNPSVKQLHIQDPYVGHAKLRLHFLAEFIDAQTLMWKGMPDAEFSRLLILHGAEDGLTSPEGSKRFHEEAKAVEKHIIIYEKAKHEIITDLCYEKVWNDILSFVMKGINKEDGDRKPTSIE